MKNTSNLHHHDITKYGAVSKAGATNKSSAKCDTPGGCGKGIGTSPNTGSPTQSNLLEK